MSMFTSIYDYFTGYDENKDPYSYKSQKQRLENPPAPPAPRRDPVPVIDIGGSNRSLWDMLADEPMTLGPRK